MSDGRVPGAWLGAASGLLAAALFGASTPLAKRLVAEADPLALAALLYLGGGLALGMLRVSHPAMETREARIGLSDAWLLSVIVVTGGMLGPVLMLVGLRRSPAVDGSLLLNLEAPFTILVAVGGFREHLGRLERRGVACILLGAVALAGAPMELSAEIVGALAIVGACFCWAIDNNVTQRLSLRDPVAVARFKMLSAGTANVALGIALGVPRPSAAVVGGALALGAVSYGASNLLDTYALRLVGAAREAAYFATAPFFGVLVAVVILDEPLGVGAIGAGILMAVGVTVLARARHSHPHEHEPLVHEHRHGHDDGHHAHAHGHPVASGEVHSHAHRHTHLTHEHPHVSDAHHRHRHGPGSEGGAG